MTFLEQIGFEGLWFKCEWPVKVKSIWRYWCVSVYVWCTCLSFFIEAWGCQKCVYISLVCHIFCFSFFSSQPVVLNPKSYPFAAFARHSRPTLLNVILRKGNWVSRYDPNMPSFFLLCKHSFFWEWGFAFPWAPPKISVSNWVQILSKKWKRCLLKNIRLFKLIFLHIIIALLRPTISFHCLFSYLFCTFLNVWIRWNCVWVMCNSSQALFYIKSHFCEGL